MEVTEDSDSVQFYFGILFAVYIFTVTFGNSNVSVITSHPGKKIIIIKQNIHVVDLSTLQCKANYYPLKIKSTLIWYTSVHACTNCMYLKL